MRIFVVSDTHGKIEDFLGKIETIEKPDLVIHLGDYVDDGLEIEKVTGVKTIIVKGNGDYSYSQYSEDEIINLNGKKVFITHGHNYNVTYSLDNLLYKSEELDADLLLYGHTHVPLITNEKGRVIMNPGSATLPRSFDRTKTFGIIEISEKISGKIVKINKL